MKGMRGDINLSSRGVKFNTSGLTGKVILLALINLAHAGNFPFFNAQSQVQQIHSLLSTLFLPVMEMFRMLGEHDLYRLLLPD